MILLHYWQSCSIPFIHCYIFNFIICWWGIFNKHLLLTSPLLWFILCCVVIPHVPNYTNQLQYVPICIYYLPTACHAPHLKSEPLFLFSNFFLTEFITFRCDFLVTFEGLHYSLLNLSSIKVRPKQCRNLFQNQTNTSQTIYNKMDLIRNNWFTHVIRHGLPKSEGMLHQCELGINGWNITRY